MTRSKEDMYCYLKKGLITAKNMMVDKRIVLKRPRKESARKAPSIGKMEETPIQVLTFLAAVAVDSWRSFVRYVMRFPDKP